jgi:hypothetical protein
VSRGQTPGATRLQLFDMGAQGAHDPQEIAARSVRRAGGLFVERRTRFQASRSLREQRGGRKSPISTVRKFPRDGRRRVGLASSGSSGTPLPAGRTRARPPSHLRFKSS